MGQFIVKVTAVGAHGCKRDVKDGEVNYGCRSFDCPDCIARDFVDTLKRRGVMLEEATLTHWPGQDGQVVDDLITHKRTGNF